MANQIIKDQVTIEAYQRYNYATSCEDCTHFDGKVGPAGTALAPEGLCTFGFPTAPHLKQQQLKDLEEKGEMAFCRAIEID